MSARALTEPPARLDPVARFALPAAPAAVSWGPEHEAEADRVIAEQESRQEARRIDGGVNLSLRPPRLALE